MERLTERDFQGNKLVLKNSVECTTENIKKWSVNESAIGSITIRGEAVGKLARYEDLEEQGLLLKLPCKVGDTLYCIYERYTKCSENDQEFDEYSCQGCECLECDSHKEYYVQSQKAYSFDWIVPNLNRFGKTVFLTQAEAEQKLKEMKS